MSPRWLRWLALLAFLGLLGIPLRQHLLYVLFGFSGFAMFFPRPDERSEANFGRAASFAYVATLISFMIGLVVAVALVGNQSAGDKVAVLALTFAAVYAVHILSFVISYVYFDARGA